MPTGDSVAQGQLNIALAELKEVRAENERLRKQVERLKAPVSIDELRRYSRLVRDTRMFNAQDVDDVLAARAREG
jgi:hypothetical protein